MPALAYAGLGLKAILHCPSSAKPPVNTVEWKKNGISIFPQQVLLDPIIALLYPNVFIIIIIVHVVSLIQVKILTSFASPTCKDPMYVGFEIESNSTK